MTQQIRESILRRVSKVIREILMDSDLLIDETSVLVHLGSDSLDFVEIIMGVEDEFGCGEIDDDTAEACTTVGKIVDAVMQKQGLTV